ncbi:hypothetical protein FQR65_LT06403 [Abscondita terminalis]|nr:hypothetical protein FQR65_LT06403 [Abscondita terminalis]
MWLLILCCLILYLLYKNIVKVYFYWKLRGVPYVRPWPLVGNMSEIVLQKKEACKIIQEFYDAFPNDRYCGLYQFSRPTLLIRDPNLIKTITIKEFASFPEHYLFNNDDNDTLENKGLFSLGAKSGWGNMRKTLNRNFTPNSLKEMLPVIDDCGIELINYLFKYQHANIDLKETFTKLSCNALARIIFNIDCNCFEEPIPKLYNMGNQINNFSGFKFVRMFAMSLSRTLTKILCINLASEEVFQYFFSLIKKSIQDYNNRDKPRDKRNMVHLLTIDHLDNSNPDNCDLISVGRKILNVDEIAMQLFGFFIGGYDAIPSLLSYTFYELSVNPEIQQRLYQEICICCNNYDDLLKNKYLNMVTSEVLRKWPISVFVDRKCVKPFVIEPEKPNETKLLVEPGVVCWIPIYAIHRDPKYYSNPEKFDPERFVDQTQQMHYLPFGSGPRTCIASKLSMYVCKLIVSKVLQSFKITCCNETVVPGGVSKVVIFLSGAGTKVIFQPRNKHVVSEQSRN